MRREDVLLCSDHIDLLFLLLSFASLSVGVSLPCFCCGCVVPFTMYSGFLVARQRDNVCVCVNRLVTAHHVETTKTRGGEGGEGGRAGGGRGKVAGNQYVEQPVVLVIFPTIFVFSGLSCAKCQCLLWCGHLRVDDYVAESSCIWRTSSSTMIKKLSRTASASALLN